MKVLPIDFKVVTIVCDDDYEFNAHNIISGLLQM